MSFIDNKNNYSEINNNSLEENELYNEYSKLCKVRLKVISKNKLLIETNKQLEN